MAGRTRDVCNIMMCFVIGHTDTHIDIVIIRIQLD